MDERAVNPFARDVVLRGGPELPDGPTMTARPSGRSAGSGERAEPPGILSGRKLAQFELKGLLGAGGFGEVYRSRDTKLDRAVAVKVLPASVAVDGERRERFRREAIAASALNHPNICTVHDLVEADGHFLIVMELVEGHTLHEALAKRPFSPAEALAIALQVAEALGEAHRAGILHRDIKCRIPGNPALEALWKKATDEETLDTDPSGATVAIEPVPFGSGPIEVVGRTPLKKLRVVSSIGLWRISKPGYAPLEAFGAPDDDGVVKLWRESDVPPGMSVVLGGQAGLPSPFAYVRRVAIGDFFVDRHEVSNAAYARFVDAGGYQKPEYWKQPFVRDGRIVSREEAIGAFRDSTGRAGPATWEVGRPQKGREDYPVSGISWYEAAAYAEFAGKSLPSVYHWTWASQPWAAYLTVPGSNFRDTETWPCGRPGTASGFGTTDMAGNVKEWCWNESWAGKRYILGGGFGEPEYGFTQTDAQSPWARLPNYGFRCVKLPTTGPAASFEKLERTVVDYSREKPVANEVFAAIRGLYAYDRSDLQAKVEGTAREEDATHETVSFRAAYGAERVRLHLFLPVNARPPYQPVLYFPGAYALFAKEFRVDQLADSALFSSYLRAGRAVVFPIYRGTLERQDGLKVGGPETNPEASWRDHVVDWSKDIGRFLDYPETRDDFDLSKLGYVGYSLGGAAAPEFLSVETRFRAAVLACAGLYGRRALPEADAFDFLPRVRIPTLLVGGRYDDRFPMVTSQIPFFQSLGTPPGDKRQVFCEAGHFPPMKDYVRESLAWLEKYLGPVTTKSAPKG